MLTRWAVGRGYEKLQDDIPGCEYKIRNVLKKGTAGNSIHADRNENQQQFTDRNALRFTSLPHSSRFIPILLSHLQKSDSFPRFTSRALNAFHFFHTYRHLLRHPVSTWKIKVDSRWMNTNREHWWNDNGKRKAQSSQESLSQWYSVTTNPTWTALGSNPFHSLYLHSTNCETSHSIILPLLCCFSSLTPTIHVYNILQASQTLYAIACNEYEIRLRTSANSANIRLTPGRYTAG
jgi:hypothetical protein